MREPFLLSGDCQRWARAGSGRKDVFQMKLDPPAKNHPLLPQWLSGYFFGGFPTKMTETKKFNCFFYQGN